MNPHTLSDRILFQPLFDGPWTNATQNGTAIDTLGYRRMLIIINFFTGSATTGNFTLSEGDTVSTATTIITGATLGAAVVASTADTGPYLINVDLAKRKRWIRLNVVGTGAAGNCSAVAALYLGEFQAPTQVQTVINV